MSSATEAPAAAAVPGSVVAAPPRVILGLPVYNGGEHARPAFESLLAQSFGAFALVMVDDRSTDGTAEMASTLAEGDPRLHFERNPRRLGTVGNWRRVFERALELHPGAEYFAWVSDHDLWEPRWLETLVAALDARPRAVLAYPQNTRIDDAGALVRPPWSFDTAGVRSARRRVWRASFGMRAGSMVYGLARVDAVERAGVFRATLNPDRLFVAQMAAQGELLQAPEVLIHRRGAGSSSLARHRAAFFPDRRPPLYVYTPWWLQHGVASAWALAVRGRARPAIGRTRGALLAAVELAADLSFAADRRLDPYRDRARMRLHRGRKRVRVRIGAVYYAVVGGRRG